MLRFRDHTQAHNTRYASCGRKIGPSQGPLTDNTQHSQEKNSNAVDGIRTRNPSMPAAAGPRLRPHGHWVRLTHILMNRTACMSGVTRKRLYTLGIHVFMFFLNVVSQHDDSALRLKFVHVGYLYIINIQLCLELSY